MARRRKPKEYKLKPATFKSLSGDWREIINTLKKIKTVLVQYGNAPVKQQDEKKWIKTLYQLKETLEKIELDPKPLRKIFKLHVDALEALRTSSDLLFRTHVLVIEIICHLTKKEHCRDAEDLYKYVDGLSLEKANAAADYIMSFPEEESLQEYRGGELIFLAGEVQQLIDNLLLLKSASEHFQTKREFLSKIGPCVVYLERGPFTPVEESEVHATTQMVLDGIVDILIKYKQAGVPDYALAGDIILELGLPPLDHGGTYATGDNALRVTLESYRNRLSLSADYEHELHRAKKEQTILSAVFGRGFDEDPPQTYTDIPAYFTIAHELAHRIYYRGLRPKAKEMWETLYAATTVSNDDAELLREYFDVLQKYKSTKHKVDNEPGYAVMQRYVDNYEKRIEKLQKEITKRNLKDLVHEMLRAPFRNFDPATFSNILWPTAYARINEREAFAEAVIMVLWEDYNIIRHRRRSKITPQEWQNFKDLVWYFIRSLRPQKLK